MEATSKKNLAMAILEKVSEKQSANPEKKPMSNPAARAMLQALKDDDAEKLTSSLSDFIKIHMSSS
tara:strand:+ start:5464 stop:5661 length:198 start_codon:yes stop_codon:yes gene_type:complete